MRAQVSPTVEGDTGYREVRALAPMVGIVNGCLLGLACWGGVLWLVLR